MNVWFMCHWFSLLLGLFLYIIIILFDCFDIKVKSKFLYLRFVIIYILCYGFSYGWFILVALCVGCDL